MLLKLLFCIALILSHSSTGESRRPSSCPEKCLHISRRVKFRCRRLFQSCKLATCIRTNEKGEEERGVICTQKDSISIDTSPSASVSPPPSVSSFKDIPIFGEAANRNSSFLRETSTMPDIESSPAILEESIAPESSSESEYYDAEVPSPEMIFPPSAEETNESEPVDIDDPRLIVNSLHTFEGENTQRHSSEPKENLEELSMRTVLGRGLSKEELFYDDDKRGEEEDESIPDSFSTDDLEEYKKQITLEASPKIIRVGEPSIVKLSLKMQGRLQIDGLESFRAYRLSSITHNRTGLCAELADDGTAIYFDDTPQDDVFTGVFAISTDKLNERISFEVVPVIDGLENKSHPLSFRAEHVISSYGTQNPSADAIGGGLMNSPRMIIIDSLKDLQLNVHFIQFGDSTLVSSAQFLHDVVGVDCEETGNSNELMQFTDEGNVQTVSIDLDSAVEKGLLEDSISVQLRAAYEEPENQTPILLVSVLEKKANKTVLNDTRLSVPVLLGVERQCPETVVGKISVFVGEKTAIVLKGTSMRKVAPTEY